MDGFRAHIELIHALRAGIAALLGYGCYLLLAPKGLSAQWILITIVVIMCSNSALGTQISRSLWRMLATLIGSILAIGVLMLPTDQGLLAIALCLIVSLAVFISVSKSKYSYAASLGAITFCMISLANTPGLPLALARSSEILLGILISLIVSRVIFPTPSETLIKKLGLINLSRLADLYKKVLLENKDRFNDPDIMSLDSQILESHTNQRQLHAHIKFEQPFHSQNPHVAKQFIRNEMALYRYFSVIEVLERILAEYRPDKRAEWKNQENYLKKNLNAYITTLCDLLIKISKQDDLEKIQNQVKNLKDLNTELEDINNTPIHIHNSKIYQAINALIFIQSRIVFVCEDLIRYYA
jgi:uncharacterized membrane protein YccC